MKAVRYYGKGDVRVETDVPEPELQPGGVLVKPAFTGLCGSDLHLYFMGAIPPAPPSDSQAHPVTGETLPITLGHEFSGTVVAVADDVEGLAVGDNVAIDPVSGCGACDACRAGAYNTCGDMACRGISGGGGGLSELVSVPAGWVHPIGDIPLDQAAMFDPLCVGYHGVKKSGAAAGDVALVAGGGPVGLLTAAVLKGIGATVILSEPTQNRRDAARNAGIADRLVCPVTEDLQAVVAELTDGRGVDVAYDCAGVEAAIQPLLDALRAGGRLEMLAVYPEAPKINLLTVLFKELVIEGSVGYDHTAFPGAIAMVREGRIDLAPFITSRIKADDFVEDGLEFLEEHKDVQIKMVVEL
ncbi:MAG: 2,3-butanediol dehydrogenase [Gordonia sp. (in: high G+C Gram-positive bacteria)]|uniref:2,3-butanediol dehydrogenase n=1 Tax=Gordonia sp. (in: high G+C Gram-positive bacteria) TaxID=84139 RepID=UPI0039E2C9DA